MTDRHNCVPIEHPTEQNAVQLMAMVRDLRAQLDAEKARANRCMDILREIALHDRMETSNETMASIDSLLKDYQ
jgi:hypothetical protein